MRAPPINQGIDQSAITQSLDKLENHEREETQFSWGKGIILGIVGKIAGTGIAESYRKSFKSKLQDEVMHTDAVRSALKQTTDAAGHKAVIDKAMGTAMKDMKGLRGAMVRNPGWTKILGGVAGGVAALGLEYASHSMEKEKSEENLQEVKKVKSWANRIETEKQGLFVPER